MLAIGFFPGIPVAGGAWMVCRPAVSNPVASTLEVWSRVAVSQAVSSQVGVYARVEVCVPAAVLEGALR